MAEREYVWTDEGIRAAGRNGVELTEAVDALYAPPGMRFERRLGHAVDRDGDGGHWTGDRRAVRLG